MRSFLLLAAAAMLPFSASANLNFDMPLANAISFGDGQPGSCSSGPTTAVDAGFSISTDGAACFSWTSGWSFADNGQWNTLPALADSSGTTTLTINLGGSYSSVWGFMDFTLGCPQDFSGPCTFSGNDPIMTALDKNLNVIESLDIGPIIAGSNNEFDFAAGETLGFTESTADIAYLQIGGDGIAMTDIALEGAASPEPGTLGCMGLAVLMLAFLLRRRFLATM